MTTKMTARITWKLGGDSVDINIESETLGFDGGHAGDQFRRVLTDAGLNPKSQKKAEFDRGGYPPGIPYPLGSDCYWRYTVEIEPKTLDKLREAQVLIDEERAAWRTEALKKINDQGLSLNLYTDEMIADATRNAFPFLHVRRGSSLQANVTLYVPADDIDVQESPAGLVVRIGEQHLFEQYNSSLARKISRAAGSRPKRKRQ